MYTNVMTGERVQLLNLSISAVNIWWGCRKVDYLGHRVSSGGLEAHSKYLLSVVDFSLPMSKRAMQSFLGRQKYYSRFIENYAVYASVLYELREIEFHARRIQLIKEDHALVKKEEKEKWTRVRFSFAMLKNNIARSPILRLFDSAKEAVIFVYASK